MDEKLYKAMYPTGCTPPKSYGLPKIHKTRHPLRPIVLSRGSVTYGMEKVLAKILRPLLGKSLPSYTKYKGLCYQNKQGYSLTEESAYALIMSQHCLPLFQ